MSTTSKVSDLLSETAWQQAQDARMLREESYKEGNTRNVGGTMGKNDFLMLLAAQLRYQDPLNPQSDSEFASQLAQFSTLEQMQNMNTTLATMAGYQAYSLVGKYVIAEAVVDGVLSAIPGVVDSIFTKNGVTFATVGDYTVPISSITDVYDSSTMLTPDMLIQTSNNLLGRTVKAQIGKDVYEGVVTRITVDQGFMYALIDDGKDYPRFVPVGAIFDIRQTGTSGELKPNTEEPKDPVTDPVINPPERPNLVKDREVYIESDEEGTQIGFWAWDAEDEK